MFLTGRFDTPMYLGEPTATKLVSIWNSTGDKNILVSYESRMAFNLKNDVKQNVGWDSA